MTAERSPEQYAAQMTRALGQRREGRQSELPSPRTPAEYLAVLDQAIALVDQLSPAAELDPAVSRLPIAEKLILGQKACDALGALAYQHAPAQTLDKLDAQGHLTERSQETATALLQRIAPAR